MCQTSNVINMWLIFAAAMNIIMSRVAVFEGAIMEIFALIESLATVALDHFNLILENDIADPLLYDG